VKPSENRENLKNPAFKSIQKIFSNATSSPIRHTSYRRL
jgi:hypothetical protein